ncbi:hypothetical protein D1872_339530 [compost metagenome]
MRDAALLSAMGQGPQVTPTSLRMTITIIVIVPVFIIYPFMQRYFVKGIMIGAVKG